MTLIFDTLRIVNFGKITIVINIIRLIILIIAIIITIMNIDYKEKNTIFIVKKVVVTTSIWIISYGKQKNFANKTKNFVAIKANITHF